MKDTNSMKTNQIYDFADEANYKEDNKIHVQEEKYKNLKIKTIEVLDDIDSTHGKGNYLSFEIDHFYDHHLPKKTIQKIVDKIELLLDQFDLPSSPHVLFVGLGNDEYSSDALGPETIKKIHANSHYEELNSKISCIIPGVMKTTGLESASIIKSLVKEFHFDLVIVIDSLTTRNCDRLFRVIQVTDTQIIPGSGVNNFRKSLNSEYLGVPLLAVGISMAIPYYALIEKILDYINLAKLTKRQKEFLKKEMDNDIVFTSKDTEIVVNRISDNLSAIFNYLFHKSTK